METAQKNNIKTQTAKGKKIAKFTMLCDFKEKHQRVNLDTGALTERWTYRSDLENAKYAAAHDGNGYSREINILGYIFNRDNFKYTRCRIFDNRANATQQLLVEWNNGKLHYPVDSIKRAKITKWLKGLV